MSRVLYEILSVTFKILPCVYTFEQNKLMVTKIGSPMLLFIATRLLDTQE